jgi:hypothetical protein
VLLNVNRDVVLGGAQGQRGNPILRPLQTRSGAPHRQRWDAFFPTATERADEGDDAATGRELRWRTKPASLERGGRRALELRVGGTGAGAWGAVPLTGVRRCGCQHQRGMERGGG